MQEMTADVVLQFDKASIKEFAKASKDMGNKLNNSLKKSTNSLKKMNKGIKNNVTSFSKLKKIGNKLNFSKNIDKNTRSLKKMNVEMKKTKRSSGESIGKLKKFIVKAGVLVGIKKATDTAAEFEQMKVTLGIVAKDSKKAGKMFSDAVKLANNTPFDTKSVVEATVVLENYGISSKNLLV